MIPERYYERILGDAKLRRARNKNRGGTANHDGLLFEKYYTMSRIISLAAQAFDDVTHGRGILTEFEIRSQVVALVDDLFVSVRDQDTYSQIKKVYGQSWRSGTPSIYDDFIDQQRVILSLARADEIELVVHDANLAQRRRNDKPHDLHIVEVVYHPVGVVPRDLVRLERLQDDFRTLLYPYADEVTFFNAVKAIDAAWNTLGWDCDLQELSELSRTDFPQITLADRFECYLPRSITELFAPHFVISRRGANIFLQPPWVPSPIPVWFEFASRKWHTFVRELREADNASAVDVLKIMEDVHLGRI